MGSTISEKILATHSGREYVKPGEIVFAHIDSLITNEINAAMCFREYGKLQNAKIWDKSRIVVVPDHYAPNKDVASAQQCKFVREFCQKEEFPYYYEVGRMGIEHVLFHEKGFVAPGELVIGVDSHSCTHGALGAFATGVASTDMLCAMTLGELWFKVPESIKITFAGPLPERICGKDLILYTIGKLGLEGARYKAIEFYGEAIEALSMDSRFSLCNMAVECGAKTAIIPADSKSIDYAKARAKREFTPVYADPDAVYETEYTWDIGYLQPQVAAPDEPANVLPVGALVYERIRVDQVFIGSCTNGRIEDMRVAADILKGHKVSNHVRLIVIPGSQDVYLQAMTEGLFEIMVEAGAAISTPTCGPCVGGHMGCLADGDVCLATSNRNFKGRMGHINSRIYLSGPAVAAATAIAGYITSPFEVI